MVLGGETWRGRSQERTRGRDRQGYRVIDTGAEAEQCRERQRERGQRGEERERERETNLLFTSLSAVPWFSCIHFLDILLAFFQGLLSVPVRVAYPWFYF